MVGAREFAYYLYGAWRLVRRDTDGLQHFPNTVEAFWRSFQAAVYAAPLVIISVATQLGSVSAKTSGAFQAIVVFLFYVIGWVLFPLIMFYLSRILDRQDRYLRYVVTYNWASVLTTAVFFVVFLFDHAAGLAKNTSQVLTSAVWIVVYIYMGYIARVALDVSIRAAIGIAVLDYLLSNFLMLVLAATIRVQLPAS